MAEGAKHSSMRMRRGVRPCSTECRAAASSVLRFATTPCWTICAFSACRASAGNKAGIDMILAMLQSLCVGDAVGRVEGLNKIEHHPEDRHLSH